MKRYAKKENRIRGLLRRATTMASTATTVGGKPKQRGKVRPITLPKIEFSVSDKE
jgi:hypothetical protein